MAARLMVNRLDRRQASEYERESHVLATFPRHPDPSPDPSPSKRGYQPRCVGDPTRAN
jgi:hypothetical protein